MNSEGKRGRQACLPMDQIYCQGYVMDLNTYTRLQGCGCWYSNPQVTMGSYKRISSRQAQCQLLTSVLQKRSVSSCGFVVMVFRGEPVQHHHGLDTRQQRAAAVLQYSVLINTRNTPRSLSSISLHNAVCKAQVRYWFVQCTLYWVCDGVTQSTMHEENAWSHHPCDRITINT